MGRETLERSPQISGTDYAVDISTDETQLFEVFEC